MQTGARDTRALAEGLTDILSDTYRLMFKTHSYHWNVTGPLFYPIHKMTEEQYTDLFKAADGIAERIELIPSASDTNAPGNTCSGLCHFKRAMSRCWQRTSLGSPPTAPVLPNTVW